MFQNEIFTSNVTRRWRSGGEVWSTPFPSAESRAASTPSWARRCTIRSARTRLMATLVAAVPSGLAYPCTRTWNAVPVVSARRSISANAACTLAHCGSVLFSAKSGGRKLGWRGPASVPRAGRSCAPRPHARCPAPPSPPPPRLHRKRSPPDASRACGSRV